MSAAAIISDVLDGAARWCVVEGDAAEVTRSLPTGRFDALVTDPPSGIAFMGAEWDRDKGGRLQWAAWLAGILADARRATRDGGRSLVWSLPRTSHWTGCAAEDAGWSIETTIAHLFGTGWPKAKAQTKPAQETWWLSRNGRSEPLNIDACRVGAAKRVPGSTTERTWHGRMGATADDQDGQNPNVGRYPPNLVLSHAPGCVCEGVRRILGHGQRNFRTESYAPPTGYMGGGSGGITRRDVNTDADGLEPVEAWRCVEGCPVAELDRQSGERKAGWFSAKARRGMGYSGSDRGVSPRTVGAHALADTGTASRFFPQFPADDPDAPWSEALFIYAAKPSRAERNAGCEALAEGRHVVASGRMLNPTCVNTGLRAQHCTCGACAFDAAATPRAANNHPTVKSIALMRWLIRLVTKPGDVVLDPFGGSGTTGVAALLEGRRVVLVEREPQYAAIARARVAAALEGDREVAKAPKARAVERPATVVAAPRAQLSLFDAAGAR